MPLFRAADKLVYYAHVPKCGGSAVGRYLTDRFGPVAFSDELHSQQPAYRRWSRTSPQHIDRDSLARLFPPGFIDATFSIVRHPVPRLVSAYHFQVEVERSLSSRVRFGDWLMDLEERRAEDPFCFDNHVRPMCEIVPETAQVFPLEAGLAPLVDWLDGVTGSTEGPREIARTNERGRRRGASDQVTPSQGDIARIASLYAADFDRFGYDPERADSPGTPRPARPEPGLARDRVAGFARRLRRRTGV